MIYNQGRRNQSRTTFQHKKKQKQKKQPKTKNEKKKKKLVSWTTFLFISHNPFYNNPILTYCTNYGLNV